MEEKDKVFALTLQKRNILCGIEVWQTVHPRIVIILQNTQKLHPTMPILTQNVDLMNYVNSKLLYIEQTYKRDVNMLYTDTIHRRCLTK